MIKKFNPKLTIYTSSRSIYGEVKNPILRENTNILNPDVYGQTKFLGEKILEEAGNTISLRLSTVLCKGAPGWISNVYHRLSLNKKIEMVDTKINNFIHIIDVFNIINFFFKKKKFFTDQFNICSSKTTSSKKIVYLMKKLLNSNSKIVQKPRKENYYTISNNKLKKYYLTLPAEEAIYKFVNDFGK
jgi:nucleoside-diphosphate-sugar epimerase